MDGVKQKVWGRECRFPPGLGELNREKVPLGKARHRALRAVPVRAGRWGCPRRNFADPGGTPCIPGLSRRAIGVFAYFDRVPAGNGWRRSLYETTRKDGILTGGRYAGGKSPASSGQDLDCGERR